MLHTIIDYMFYLDVAFIFGLLVFGIHPSFFMDIFDNIFRLYGYLHSHLVTLWQKVMD